WARVIERVDRDQRRQRRVKRLFARDQPDVELRQSLLTALDRIDRLSECGGGRWSSQDAVISVGDGLRRHHTRHAEVESGVAEWTALIHERRSRLKCRIDRGTRQQRDG